MKNTASIQENSSMGFRTRGMYGSTVNEVDRSFGNRPHRSRVKAHAQAKIHPGEAGVVSGRRVRIEIPAVGRLFTLRGILLMLVSILTIGAAVILMFFNFEKAAIYGNTKYSPQQIESFITRGTLGENTFVMALKYHHRKVSDIPFVDRIDIDIVSPSTVRVNITEKPTDGCIFYNGNNVYFSKEGIIQTVSGRKVEDATIVNGVVLTHSNTGAQILAKNQLGLDLSLELMRAADKYGIRVDSIDVDARNNLTFWIGDVKVRIGKTGYDNKMFRLHRIYPYLEGRSGVISMSGYKDTYDSNYNIVLSPAESEAAALAAEEAEGKEAAADDAAEESGEDPAAAEPEESAKPAESVEESVEEKDEQSAETAAPGEAEAEAGAVETGGAETAEPGIAEAGGEAPETGGAGAAEPGISEAEAGAPETGGAEAVEPGTAEAGGGALEAGETETVQPGAGGPESSGPENTAPEGSGAEPSGQETGEVINSASQGSRTTASAAPEGIPVPRKSP